MKKFILAVFALVLSSQIQAKDTKEETLSKIQASLQKNTVLKLEFKQTVYTSVRKRKRKSHGYAYFKQPSMFRWAIEKPYPNHLIYNGRKFASINPKAKSGTIYPSSSGELKKYGDLVSIVMDIEKLLVRFKIDEIENHSELARITLSPKTQENIKTVELHVSHKMKIISSLKIDYRGGNYWKVDFMNPSFSNLPKSAFEIPNDKSYNIRTL